MAYQEYPKSFHGHLVQSPAEEAAVAKSLGIPVEPKPTAEPVKQEGKHEDKPSTGVPAVSVGK
jgi:hypothetical protein